MENAVRRPLHSAGRPPTRIGWGLLVLVTAFITTVVTTSPIFSQKNSQNQVAISVLDGESVSGKLKNLSDEKVLVQGDSPAEFPTTHLLRVQFQGRNYQPIFRGGLVLLENGDRLKVAPRTIDTVALTADWIDFPAWPSLEIPLETIRGIILDVPQSTAVRDHLVQTLRGRQADSDALILKNGDRVTGEFLGMDEEKFTLETAVGEVKIPRAGVRALGFNSELISFPKAEGLRALVTLQDGSHVTVQDLQMPSSELLSFKPLFGKRQEIPLSSVVSLQFFGGRAVYLSDLTPAEYRFTPYLDTQWKLRKDRNVLGGPLRLEGTEYAKGLGLHSRCEVVYDLDGQYSRFQALVGINDGAGKLGSAVVSIKVDGRTVLQNQLLTRKSQPLQIPSTDVSQAQQLKLIVDYGPFGDVQDRVNFCDALLVR